MPCAFRHCLGFCFPLLALLGCGPSDVWFRPPPDLNPTGSVVVVVRNGAAYRLFAAEAADRPLFSLDLSPQEDFELTTLVYEESLTALGFKTGAVELADPSVCGSRSLPLPFATYVSGERQNVWQELAHVPEAVRQLQILGQCQCAEFEVISSVTLPEVPRFAIEDSESSVLFFGAGVVKRFYADGRLIAVTSTTGPKRPTAVVVDPSGRMWVSAVDGLWVGRPETGFEHHTSLPGQGSLLDLSGGMGASGFDLYGSTAAGGLVRFDDSGPEILSVRTDELSGADQQGLVAWLGPGEVVASEEGTNDIIIHSAGRTVRRLTIVLESRGIRVLEAIEGFGIIALGQIATPYWIRDGQFQDLPRQRELATPNGLVPFEGGFVFAGESGYLQQYHPKHGYCPTQYIADRPRFLGLTRLGEQLVVWAHKLGGGFQILTLQPRL